MSETADYGLDAPGVVRNLFLAAAAALLLWLSVALGFWSGRLTVGGVTFVIGSAGLPMAIAFAATGAFMAWDSKVGKVRERDHLLALLPWSGGERVLDLGCGRGLLLVGAAKRLTTGRAIGIDIWQSEDLAGNDPRAPVQNARREGVEERVEICTADMRNLPFPDGTFDAVISRAAIHNIYNGSDRALAIREVARVLKKDGRALIQDIRHGREYAAIFSQSGCGEVRSVGSKLASLFWTMLTFGSLRPATLIARKVSS